MSEIGDTIF